MNFVSKILKIKFKSWIIFCHKKSKIFDSFGIRDVIIWASFFPKISDKKNFWNFKIIKLSLLVIPIKQLHLLNGSNKYKCKTANFQDQLENIFLQEKLWADSWIFVSKKFWKKTNTFSLDFFHIFLVVFFKKKKLEHAFFLKVFYNVCSCKSLMHSWR